MFIFIFLIIFSGHVFAQDIAAQIQSLDDQAQTILTQRKAMMDDWKKNDPDIQLWERLKAKTAQQRAMADQANELLRQKNELIDKSVD